MEEYLDRDTAINGTLEEAIINTNGSNTLYISSYYFCLKDDSNLHFFYNPKFYWDSCTLESVKKDVLTNLSESCAILKNIRKEDLRGLGEPKNYKKIEAFDIYTPKIGNHYSLFGNRILTHNSKIYLRSNYYHIDNTCDVKDIKSFDLDDLKAVLLYSVLCKTPNYIKSIYDLDIFKQN